MARPVGEGVSGSGVIQFVDSTTGQPKITGRFVPQALHSETLRDAKDALFLGRDTRGASLEETAPEAYTQLLEFGALSRLRLREEMEIKFILSNGVLTILDAVRVQRSSRAAVRIAVDLATSGVIPQQEAVLRVKPAALSELLHRQIASTAKRDIIVRGIPASPGLRAALWFSRQTMRKRARRAANLVSWCVEKRPRKTFAACMRRRPSSPCAAALQAMPRLSGVALVCPAS